jgi:hypothetical protein
MKPAPPKKWRTVKYTDDGCSLYQCLSCKRVWEARTDPGYFSSTERCEEVDEGACDMGGGKFYREIPPIYVENFKFCPYCGIRFEGPIRCDRDNERMLGERQKRIEDARRSRPCQVDSLAYWYVLMTREVTTTREGNVDYKEPWYPTEKANPADTTLAVYHALAKRRNAHAEDGSSGNRKRGYNRWNVEQFKVGIMKEDELKQHGHVSQRHCNWEN